MIATLWCPAPDVPAAVPSAIHRPLRTVLEGGTRRIKKATHRGAQELIDEFPKLRQVGGWRRHGYGAPDHPDGWALDAMVHNNRNLGGRIALHFMVHARRLDVSYIMWAHRIWNIRIERKPIPHRQWRWVPDRGSRTANHLDHVHLTFKQNG